MNHDIAYKVDDGDDDENNGDDGEDDDDDEDEDDDDYEDDDGLLQSLIRVFSPEQNLATIFSMFNPFPFSTRVDSRKAVL